MLIGGIRMEYVKAKRIIDNFEKKYVEFGSVLKENKELFDFDYKETLDNLSYIKNNLDILLKNTKGNRHSI